MNSKTFDLRTPLQKARDERNKKIMQEYLHMIKTLPKETTKWSIYRTLAPKFGLQPQGIRTIIEKELNTINNEAFNQNHRI